MYPWQLPNMDFHQIRDLLHAELQKRNRIVLAHHIDADGLTATAIMIHFLKGKTIKYMSINNKGRCLEQQQLQDVYGFKAEAVIMLDCAQKDPSPAQKLVKKGIYVISIDHHGYTPDIKAASNLFVNTVDKEIPGKTAAGLTQELVGNKETEWLAQIGLCGDLVPGTYTTKVQECATIINFAGLIEKRGAPLTTRDNNCYKLIQLLLENKDEKELLDKCKRKSPSPDYAVVRKEVDKAVEELIELETKKDPKLLFGAAKVIRQKQGLFILYEYPFQGFNTIEQVLKEHMPLMKGNTTIILCTGDEDLEELRVYTTKQGMDCGKICRKYGGGGHPNRAGTAYKKREKKEEIIAELLQEHLLN